MLITGRVRQIVQWGGLLAIALVLQACSSGQPEALRVGSNLWIGYEPLYLARSLDAYADDSVHLVELPATTDVLHALRNNELEAAALTLDEVLSERAEGMDLRVVMIMDYSSGGDALLARPGIEALGQLQGTRVGYEASAVGAVMLDAVLDAAGLTPADITPIPITPDQHLKVLAEQQVDALVSYEPFVTKLQLGGNRVLFDSKRIPGRIVDVLAVRGELLDTWQPQLAALVDGWYRALAKLHAHPQEAIDLMRQRHQLGHDAFAASLKGLRFIDRAENRRLLNATACPLRDTAGELAILMVQHGLLAHVPQMERLCDTRGLQQ